MQDQGQGFMLAGEGKPTCQSGVACGRGPTWSLKGAAGPKPGVSSQLTGPMREKARCG